MCIEELIFQSMHCWFLRTLSKGYFIPLCQARPQQLCRIVGPKEIAARTTTTLFNSLSINTEHLEPDQRSSRIRTSVWFSPQSYATGMMQVLDASMHLAATACWHPPKAAPTPRMIASHWLKFRGMLCAHWCEMKGCRQLIKRPNHQREKQSPASYIFS